MTIPLTLAIPVHNDLQPLVRLLRRVLALQIADHVVIVDDGSDAPLEIKDLSAATGFDPACLTLLHHDTPRGAGSARNLALSHVQTEYLLFLDADDLPTRELRGLRADLNGAEFDFCQFQHHDSRMGRDRLWGQMPFDQTHWTRAGVELGALSDVSTQAAQQLSQTANYPWNKIYRTEFLRDNDIRCSETRVHNDIELHWRSFLNARQILASDRIAVIHFVDQNNDRLTNSFGSERLDVFPVLEKLAIEIAAERHTTYRLPFYSFVIGLFDWISRNLAVDFHLRFHEQAQTFITTHLPDNIREDLAAPKPDLYQSFCLPDPSGRDDAAVFARP